MAARSRLPGLNDNFRTKLRPKHQLLILKCYPRLPKNSTADVKPNGSELSYLLYYASTRSSKLEKVGAFLERKASADLSKSQSAQVQVTLQIVAAIVEKVYNNAGAFALIAPHGLRILRSIVSKPTDIALVQATLPTWDAFCRFQDYALQAADPDYRGLFEQVVTHYAALAKKGDPSGKPNTRLRKAGLQALTSLLSANQSAALDSSPQLLETLMPAVLSNLRSGDDGAQLEKLVAEAKRRKQGEEAKAAERRNSASGTIARTTTDDSNDADSRAAKATPEDADTIAEQGVALSAADTLQSFFANGNKSHLRAATMAVLAYAGNLKRNSANVYVSQSASPLPEQWATKALLLLVSWTPVQDRFIVLVSAVEVLSRLPAKDADLGHNLLYAKLIHNVLSSDLNLIGLSVMDVLLSLIQKQVNVLLPDSKGPSNDQASTSLRMELVQKLKSCIASLATHIYYSDQISDMVATILAKIKPDASSTNLSVSSSSADEQGSSLRQANTASGSFPDARKHALETVRDIIDVANAQHGVGVGAADSRNRIPMTVWDNTQWLLRDPSYEVRTAYASALMAWLTKETSKSDQRLQDPSSSKQNRTSDYVDSSIRRAASTHSPRDNSKQKHAGSPFLSMLHLAHYESALQFASASDADVLLLHALLSCLVQHLGINAVQEGLPMVFALQEDIPQSKEQTTQVRLSSLVHGYLWTVSEVFGFQSQAVGIEILDEITKRKATHLWVETVNYPPTTSEHIGEPSTAISSADVGGDLKLFDHRTELVEAVLYHHNQTSASNVPSSPGRNFSRPRYAQDGSVNIIGPGDNPEDGLGNSTTTRLKQTLLTPWTKEACLAQAAALAPRSVSISGSRASRLVAGSSPHDWGSQSVRQSSVAKRTSLQQVGRASNGIDTVINGDQAPRRSAVGIDVLRQVLVSGQPAGGKLERKTLTADSDSDSMVEVHDAELASLNEEFATPLETLSPTTPAQENGRFLPSTTQATEAMGLRPNVATNAERQPGEIGKGPTRRKGHVSMLLGKIPMDEIEKSAVSIESPPY